MVPKYAYPCRKKPEYSFTLNNTSPSVSNNTGYTVYEDIDSYKLYPYYNEYRA